MNGKVLYAYKNGNYTVTIYEDGTKERVTYASKFIPEFPESLDLKITDRCDLGCPYCHESSTPYGKHANIQTILENLRGLPRGTEIAIGGGNIFEHSSLVDLLTSLAYHKFLANITINAKHIEGNIELLNALFEVKLINGLGISFDGLHFYDNDNVVYHMIVGIHKFEDIESMLKSGRKILLLGYKQHGRGKVFYNDLVKYEIKNTKNCLWKILGKGLISFDNLVIKQLELNKHLTRKGWDSFYMGNDGDFTMYYDAVDNYYASSSISLKKQIADIPITEYFKTLRS